MFVDFTYQILSKYVCAHVHVLIMPHAFTDHIFLDAVVLYANNNVCICIK